MKTGSFAFIELQDPRELGLTEIPSTFNDPLSLDHCYSLLGVVHFLSPPSTRASMSNLYLLFNLKATTLHNFDKLTIFPS